MIQELGRRLYMAKGLFTSCTLCMKEGTMLARSHYNLFTRASGILSLVYRGFRSRTLADENFYQLR